MKSGMSAHARMRRDSAAIPKQETAHSNRRRCLSRMASLHVREAFYPVVRDSARLAYLYSLSASGS